MVSEFSNQKTNHFRGVWVWLTVMLGIAVGAAVTILLWGRSTAEHRDAFDAGWKSAAATLAILAAFVTVERLRLGQREHQRQVAADLSNQITTLSSKASEQLGSDKPAVRIGGLTDLERLAQSFPELRQTVVDRICAYLRTPYYPPAEMFPRRSMRHSDTSQGAPESRSPSPDSSDDAENNDGSLTESPENYDATEARLELDVRRTAQQILERHLAKPRNLAPPDAYWHRINLDLRDATLVDANFKDCAVEGANFRNAKFYGYATFSRFNCTREACFDSAEFINVAIFAESLFDGYASFSCAHFWHSAFFNNSIFSDKAVFGRCEFDSKAEFKEANFHGDADFYGVTFGSVAFFQGVLFAAEADFCRAEVGMAAQFPDSNFSGPARFDGVHFSMGANYAGSLFQDVASFWSAEFEESVKFSGASFVERADFSKAYFHGVVNLEDSVFEKGCDLDEVRVDNPPRSRSCTDPSEGFPEWILKSRQVRLYVNGRPYLGDKASSDKPNVEGGWRASR